MDFWMKNLLFLWPYLCSQIPLWSLETDLHPELPESILEPHSAPPTQPRLTLGHVSQPFNPSQGKQVSSGLL